MGLLDSGSRWMDVVITDEGRRALSEGDFDIAYYAISDRSSSYPIEGDVGGIKWLASPSSQVMLEASVSTSTTNTARTNDFGEMATKVDDSEVFESFPDARLSKTKESAPVLVLRGPPNRDTNESDYPDVVLPIDRHYPIEQSRETSTLPQIAFLPPVVQRGSNVDLMGDWKPSTPAPVEFDTLAIPTLRRTRPIVVDAEMAGGFVTLQAFIRDRTTGETKPLLVIEQTTNDSNVRVWSLGEVVVANNETHFFRLLRVVVEPPTNEQS